MSKPRVVARAASAPGRATGLGDPTALAVPVGPRVSSLLEVAYRARRPVLLEGPTGIGKSQIVSQFARAAGISVIVLDLSLLEPPDLIGLPIIEGGRTRYASPSELPTTGRGIVMLEELNRAEIPVMQPALQLLSARRLHSYELPPGWTCVAAINPEDGEYQVNRLDPALRSRFLQLGVCADRPTWLAWAERANVHPIVQRVVREHVDAFDGASPRSWTYASDVLHALTSDERADTELVQVALRGYLPTAWALVLTDALAGAPPSPTLDLDALFDEGGAARLRDRVAQLERERQIDAVAMLSAHLRNALGGTELTHRAREGSVTLASLEALLAALPGDFRQQCLTTAVQGDAAEILLAQLGVDAGELSASYASSPLRADVRAWREEMALHRVRLIVECARRWIQRQTDPSAVPASSASFHARVEDAGVLADDLASALRARGVELRPGAPA